MFNNVYWVGVKIVFGIDSGVLFYGENVQEFEYMVEGGMFVVEVLFLVMVVSVELIGRIVDLGIIEFGKLVDIVVVFGNLFQDIFIMCKVFFVMKDGVVYKQEE